MPLHIRPATPDDAELILRFITDLAIYEKAEHEVKTDAAGIRDSLFAEGSTAHGLICENDGQPIGYAVYFFNYSTWLGKHGLYLEDLYVSPEARGLGAGKALLRHLAQLAVARLRSLRVVGAGLEHPGDRLLRILRRPSAERMDDLSPHRPGLAGLRRRLSKPASGRGNISGLR